VNGAMIDLLKTDIQL